MPYKLSKVSKLSDLPLPGPCQFLAPAWQPLRARHCQPWRNQPGRQGFRPNGRIRQQRPGRRHKEQRIEPWWSLVFTRWEKWLGRGLGADWILWSTLAPDLDFLRLSFFSFKRHERCTTTKLHTRFVIWGKSASNSRENRSDFRKHFRARSWTIHSAHEVFEVKIATRVKTKGCAICPIIAENHARSVCWH